MRRIPPPEILTDRHYGSAVLRVSVGGSLVDLFKFINFCTGILSTPADFKPPFRRVLDRRSSGLKTAGGLQTAGI